MVQFAQFGSYSHPRLQLTLVKLELIEDAKSFSSKFDGQPNRKIAYDLLEDSADWRAMKVIVLGNGTLIFGVCDVFVIKLSNQ